MYVVFNRFHFCLCIALLVFCSALLGTVIYIFIHPPHSNTRPLHIHYTLIRIHLFTFIVPHSTIHLFSCRLCMHAYTEICTMFFNKGIFSVHVNAVFAYPFCLFQVSICVCVCVCSKKRWIGNKKLISLRSEYVARADEVVALILVHSSLTLSSFFPFFVLIFARVWAHEKFIGSISR